MAKTAQKLAKPTQIDTEIVEKATLSEELGDYADFFLRLSDSLISGDIFGNIADWLRENTKLQGKPFSFFEHEFQIEIAGDPSEEGIIEKCSQVGLTELAVRMALAYLGISNGRSLIYVLPTSRFASKFSKSRIDPIIDNSKKLQELLVTAANSSEMKRLGDSFLYINGAANEEQAISVPAEGLFIDEFDRCNPAIAGMYNSRSRHTKGNAYKRKWSTPTIDDWGINALYKASRCGRYVVKCDHCNKYVFPDFMRDVVIPGFDDEFENFRADCLNDPNIFVDDSYLACMFCRKPLDHALSVASRREWVKEFPQRDVAGWRVYPFDLIAYNPTAKVIKQIKEYPRTGDYRNMVLGQAYTAENAKFDAKLIEKLTKILEASEAAGCCMGIDVGKICYIVIGKKIGKVYEVFKIMRVNIRDGSLKEQIVKLCERFRLRKMVIDAGPDFELVQNLKTHFGDKVNPCVYIPDNAKITNYFDISTSEKTEGTVNAQRTKGFDALVESVNESKFIYPKSDEQTEFLAHMGGMKRVEHLNEDGEMVARWVKTGPDHYLHALFYFKLACDIVNSPEANDVIAAPFAVTGTTVGKSLKKPPEAESLRTVMGMLRFR